MSTHSSPVACTRLFAFASALAAISVTLMAAPAGAAPTTVTSDKASWTLQNDRLRVTIANGQVDVLDKSSGYDWKQVIDPDPARFGNPRIAPKSATGAGVQFEIATGGAPATVTLRLADGGSDVTVTTDVPDPAQPCKDIAGLAPFVLDSSNGAIALADYCGGHVYPTDLQPFPLSGYEASRLDMPWIGVCDLTTGYGYAMIVDTSDDARVTFKTFDTAGRKIVAPMVSWKASKGAFGYTRTVIYHFSPTGNYVSLAKAYRAYAMERGLIVPLADKVKRNPNIARLFGAPDIWGDSSLRFAKQAKVAGIDKMLIHGKSSANEMRAINDIGYLTSAYDNYDDIQPIDDAHGIDSNHDVLPDHAVLKADGTRMTAWLTWDKKIQYMKRCPSFWVPSAKLVVPKLLATYPYLGRFIDVATAEHLYECYDPNHPLTKAQKRQCGIDLSAYMSSLGLVVGGEHGIWWAPMHEDYIEGMMSGGYASWPAGHLKRPDTKDQEFTNPDGWKLPTWSDYARLGIGHQWRAPLWELVFHDCVVSTWYWGDSSDWLLKAAPEITPKKDAFNVLYGTIPLMWASPEGGWKTNRDVCMRTYRNTCKLHEAVAQAEFVSHSFVTPDHDVQSSVFSDGTRTVVNFGNKPYTAKLGGRDYVLPQNGWVVDGPKVKQSLSLENDTAVTTIAAPAYRFSDRGGVGVAIRGEGSDRVVVNMGKTTSPVTVDLTDVAPRWDMKSTAVYQLSEIGDRVGDVPLVTPSRGKVTLPAGDHDQVFEIACRGARATTLFGGKP